MAGTANPEDLKKIRSQIEKRNLVGASNSTKWDELISFIRGFSTWRPFYRYKSVFGGISKWDNEWSHHLPFPFVGIEWFDIGLHEHVHVGRLLPTNIIDHSESIITKLKEIGFDFEMAGDIVRIWGYLPKSYEDFPPAEA